MPNRYLIAAAVGMCLATPGYGQILLSAPGEGDCSAEFIHDFSSARRCSEKGSCRARQPTLRAAVLLKCGQPWGDILRLCFDRACVDGRATERRVAQSGRLVSSIIANPERLGGYPKRVAASVMLGPAGTPFPNQVTLFAADAAPFTDLVFGKYDTARLSDTGGSRAGSKKARRLQRYVAKPLSRDIPE